MTKGGTEAQLRDALLRTAQLHVLKYSAMFFGYDESWATGAEPTTIGSGVFVRSPDDRVLVATCGHNIRADKSEKPTEAFAFLRTERPDDTAWKAVSMMKWGGDGRPGETWDLGYVEPPPTRQVPEQLGRLVLPWDRLDPDWVPKPNTPVLLYGLTQDSVVRREHPSGKPWIRVGDNAFGTMPLAFENLEGTTVRPEIDLFFEYPTTMETSAGEMPTPSVHGMSGGGVWALEMGAKVWHPDRIRLVGIVRSTREGWVRATHIKHWMAMVEGRWPS